MNIKTIAALSIAGAFLAIGAAKDYLTKKENVQIDVVKTERIQQGDSQKYMVYAENGVYENTDSIWFFKFNSADLYAKIKENKSYSCTTTGWRVQLLSWQPNIIKCTENNQ